MLSHQSLPPFFVSSDVAFNFFDTEKQLAKIHELNGFLLKLSQLIGFEIFRPLLEEACPNKEQPKRKVFDLFNELLATQGFTVQGGSIVDGTFVEVPTNVTPMKRTPKSGRAKCRSRFRAIRTNINLLIRI